MDWNEWQPFYSNIVRRLNIDSKADYRATKVLSGLIEDINPEPLLDELERVIRGRNVIVYGSGPSLKDHLEILFTKRVYSDAVHIVADGAVSAILEADGTCDLLITDLDGNPDDILCATAKGSIPIIHAHGDNENRLRELVEEFASVIGSTQVQPLHNVFLWGGFTDGDRACFLASHYNPRKIILAGMDFGTTVGKWSKPGHTDHFPASDRKLAKLEIAQELLHYLWKTTGIEHMYLQEVSE